MPNLTRSIDRSFDFFYGGLVFISQENEVIEVSIRHRICEKELKSIFLYTRPANDYGVSSL